MNGVGRDSESQFSWSEIPLYAQKLDIDRCIISLYSMMFFTIQIHGILPHVEIIKHFTSTVEQEKFATWFFCESEVTFSESTHSGNSASFLGLKIALIDLIFINLIFAPLESGESPLSIFAILNFPKFDLSCKNKKLWCSKLFMFYSI